MIRHSSRLLTVVALTVLVAAFGVSAAELPAESEAAPASQEALTQEAELTAETAPLPVISFESPLEAALAAASYECPPNTTYCWQDSQCDAECGVGAGSCEFGCCRCFL